MVQESAPRRLNRTANGGGQQRGIFQRPKPPTRTDTTASVAQGLFHENGKVCSAAMLTANRLQGF